MLLSPEWCYSNTNSKDHFHEKVSNAVVHPTLPTPFKGEGEQQQQQWQLKKYTGNGSAGYSQGCDYSGSTEKPIDCIHHGNLPCCIHCCFMAEERSGGLPSYHPFSFVNSPVARKQCHLVKWLVITAMAKEKNGRKYKNRKNRTKVFNNFEQINSLRLKLGLWDVKKLK